MAGHEGRENMSLNDSVYVCVLEFKKKKNQKTKDKRNKRQS